MNHKPQIVVIHPNSLCGLAMRTILTDIAPFVGMFRDVEILTFNSMQEYEESVQGMVIHYFVAKDVLLENLPFFAPQSRRCIVLVEDDTQNLPQEFRSIDIRRPERDLLKSFLMMHGSAHSMHGMPTAKEKEGELSQREKDVLALIVKGYINKEIADKLNISTATVIFHRRNISEKIGSKSVGRQTIYAVMNGIVDFREL
ncbi:MAG: helix-turn-helix transcriptional regulator [Alistipes sp.]|nr:helix-turn-helix transcriptional regulator [Alistipes sp.]